MSRLPDSAAMCKAVLPEGRRIIAKQIGMVGHGVNKWE